MSDSELVADVDASESIAASRKLKPQHSDLFMHYGAQKKLRMTSCASQSELPCGPRSAEEMHDWPGFARERLTQYDLFENVLDKLQQPIVFCTDWTGMPVVDQCCSMIREDLKLAHPGVEPNFIIHRGCDNDITCQDVCMAASASSDPRVCKTDHMFENIMTRVDNEVYSELVRIENEANLRAENIMTERGTRKFSRDEVDILSGDCIDEMIKVLEVASIPAQPIERCLSHDKECPLDYQRQGQELVVWVATHCCFDWSGFLGQEGVAWQRHNTTAHLPLSHDGLASRHCY